MALNMLIFLRQELLTIREAKKRRSGPQQINHEETTTDDYWPLIRSRDAQDIITKSGDDPVDEAASLPIVHAIARSMDSRKARGIRALRVSHLTYTTEFLIIAVGTSRPQNVAIAEAVRTELEDQHGRTCGYEGNADSGWILLDYGNFIVHVMTPASREFYDLESMYEDADVVDLSAVVSPEGLHVPGEDPFPHWPGDKTRDFRGGMGQTADDLFWSDAPPSVHHVQPESY